MSEIKQWKKVTLVALAAVAIAATTAGVALSGEKPAHPEGQVDHSMHAAGEHAGHGDEGAPAETAAAELRVVPNEEVCMVNDRFFARTQIPVEVEEKTYYGCCEMCKTRLAQDQAIRFAVDPVSGETVDKATAVIAVRPDDSVLYFASQETYEQYLEAEPGS